MTNSLATAHLASLRETHVSRALCGLVNYSPHPLPWSGCRRGASRIPWSRHGRKRGDKNSLPQPIRRPLSGAPADSLSPTPWMPPRSAQDLAPDAENANDGTAESISASESPATLTSTRCEPTSAKSRSPSDALRRIRTESSAASESSNASKRSCKEITSTAWFEVTKDANLLRSSDIEATETRGIGAATARDASMAHPQLLVLHRRNSSKTRMRL